MIPQRGEVWLGTLGGESYRRDDALAAEPQLLERANLRVVIRIGSFA